MEVGEEAGIGVDGVEPGGKDGRVEAEIEGSEANSSKQC